MQEISRDKGRGNLHLHYLLSLCKCEMWNLFQGLFTGPHHPLPPASLTGDLGRWQTQSWPCLPSVNSLLAIPQFRTW